jgi:cell wall-associated NlpC family hydrolase
MKKETLRYRVTRSIIKGIGHIEFHWSPIPFLKIARGFDIRGPQQRAIMDLVRPGDVLLGRFNRHLTAALIPGDWDHVGVYVGKGMVAHVTGIGWRLIDILEFLERDAVAVLRLGTVALTQEQWDTVREEVVWLAKAPENIHIEYDYDVDFETDHRLSCSEFMRNLYLAGFAKAGIPPTIDLDLKKIFTGSKMYTPDHVFTSGLRVVHTSKSWLQKQKITRTLAKREALIRQKETEPSDGPR